MGATELVTQSIIEEFTRNNSTDSKYLKIAINFNEIIEYCAIGMLDA